MSGPRKRRAARTPRSAGGAETRESLRKLATVVQAATGMALAGGSDPADISQLFLDLSAWASQQHGEDVTSQSLAIIHAAAGLTQCWSADSEFLDARGQPNVLPLKGRRRSFAVLVRRAGGFSNASKALAVLMRHKAAASDGATVTLLSRTVIAHWATPEARARAWMASVAHLNTLNLNLSDRPQSEKRPERTVVSLRFPVKAMPVLRKAVEAQGEAFLVFLDQLMKELEERAIERGEATVGVGVGFWQFDVPTLAGLRSRTGPARRK